MDVRIQKHNANAAGLSNLIVAVAGLLFATNPALATVLAASPGATLDTNVRVLEWAITMDGGHVATEVMLSGEGTATGWMRARVGFGPVGVVSFPVGLEIEGASKGCKQTNQHRLHDDR